MGIRCKIAVNFAVAVAAAITSSDAQTITNGSFESGNFVHDNDAPGVMTLSPGASAISGWTTITDDVLWIAHGTGGLNASDGGLFLDLTGRDNSPPFGGVIQTISTVSGVSYNVQFDLGVFEGGNPTLAGPISVLLTAGSTSQLFTHNPGGSGNVWGRYNFPFTAQSSATSLTFQGQTGQNYIGLDDVTIATFTNPGDYNVNQVVDAADYVVWRKEFGSGTSLPNDDTVGVGPDDFGRWTANFGNTSLLGSGNSVPEPSICALCLPTLLILLRTRCRRKIC